MECLPIKKYEVTAEQIAYAPRQADLVVTVAEVCRKFVISETTFYPWKQLCRRVLSV